MKPSRDDDANNRRGLVLGLLVAASFLNYFDRQTLSVLKTTLKADFAFDDAGYALLVNAFTISYAVAYVASGWVVDRFGARFAMTAFVALWSLATVGCGVVSSFLGLLVFRLLLGLFEPGLHPVIIRAGTTLTPEKGRGLFMTTASLGGSIATITAVPLISALALHWHWRLAFLVPGVLGLGLALFWWRMYREPVVVLAHGEKIVAPKLAWSQLWRTRALWGVVLARFVSDPVWYFCLFWMPGYLQEQKGLSLGQLGNIGWIPFFGGTALTLLFMVLSDRCGHRFGVDGRKRLIIATSFLGLLCLLIPASTSTAAVVGLFTLVTFTCKAWLSSLAPIIAATFPAGNVAGVYGIAGAFGAVGAMFFNDLVGRAATALQPGTIFFVMSLLHPCAAVLLHLLVRGKTAPLADLIPNAS